jgi:pimeloyl-ACP methyl ester carboxylesterase
MHNFILVHGAWHSPVCWKKLTQELGVYGNILTPALVKNHDFRKISMNNYIEILRKICLELKGPITLIGHSFAAIVISEYANQFPQNIKELIFINGLIPIQGESLFSLSAGFEYQYLSPHLKVNNEEQSISINPLGKIKEYMCQLNTDILDETQFRSEPLLPLGHEFTGKRHQVPSKAIIGEHDLCISINDQIMMCERQNIPYRIIASDHCPFQSSVKELTSLIIKDF